MATKEQEKDAVEKIRRIVEELGAYSYVGTAMTGVLEVAEQNIEYDAAFSLKMQEILAKEETEKYRQEAEGLRRQLEEAEKKIEEFQERTRQAECLAAKRYMSPQVHEKLNRMLEEFRKEAEKEMMEAAVMMAGYIGEETISPDIRGAAEMFRKHRRQQTDCKMLLDAIKSYEE